MYTSSESWTNKLSIDAFKVVQIKFLAMQITNKKLSCDIFLR